MFISDKPDNYEKVYNDLVARLAGCDFAAAARDLGLQYEGAALRIPLLGGEYLVSADGVTLADGSEAPLTHRIVLAYYAMHGGSGQPAGRYVPYRELPGGADFARSLTLIVETPLAAHFPGRVPDLAAAAEALGGRPADSEIRCDAAYEFEALPKLPMMMTFYDADEDFPAEAKVFYDITAPNFLDMECLAVMGMILTLELQGADPGAK